MKDKYNIDISTLKIIYKKYKEHIIYIGIILVCILAFVYFTIPKISQIKEVGEERKAEEEKLKVLKNNLSILQNTNDILLESQLQTVLSVLPESKDFEGIFNAISIASGKTGASLSDYELGVGDLSDSATPEKGYPYLQLKLSIRANLAQTISFLKTILETAPLSQVLSISETSGNTSVDMVFYYKPTVPEDIVKSPTLTNLSQSDLELISTISKWNNSIMSEDPSEDSSGSNPSDAPPF